MMVCAGQLDLFRPSPIPELSNTVTSRQTAGNGECAQVRLAGYYLKLLVTILIEEDVTSNFFIIN